MKSSIRVLAVVHQALSARFEKNFLSSSFQFSFARNNMEFLSLLEENNFDAVLLEWNRGANESEELKICSSKNPWIPVLVLAEKLTPGKQLEIFNLGAAQIIDKEETSSEKFEQLLRISIARNLHFRKYCGKKLAELQFRNSGQMLKSIRMLSHEINNPLSRILLSTEKIKEEFTAESDGAFFISMINQATMEIDQLL